MSRRAGHADRAARPGDTNNRTSQVRDQRESALMSGTETRADEQQIIDSLHAFITQEILPIQKEVQPYFDDQRLYYEEDGRESRVVVDARKRARMAASKAGFYTMFCPKEFGGADLGYKLWFLCWESIFQ